MASVVDKQPNLAPPFRKTPDKGSSRDGIRNVELDCKCRWPNALNDIRESINSSCCAYHLPAARDQSGRHRSTDSTACSSNKGYAPQIFFHKSPLFQTNGR
jgi:hypothetical protein